MTQAGLSPITEDDIANYLVNTPDFFERHAATLAAIQLTSPHGNRAVSLLERQAELLREKIRGLELRSAEMIRHGQENTAIASRLQTWTKALLLTRDAADLPAEIAHQLTELFQVPQVAIRLWQVADEHAGAPFAQDVSEDVQAFAGSLAQPYCGSNPGLEAANWLVSPDTAASLALIPLRLEQGEGGDGTTFGLLVLASDDENRFVADMGTEFLERIGVFASAALTRLLPAVAAQD
ncbi:DUF484 family protein [Hydrogenophaga sp. 5NK40-0174]|uniref:DUF484 family protein n=1 Tax=Hydrogenophaga sp. 5NK40-0174 TaxID=3127649 RepID=UPI003108D8B9